MKKIFIPLGCFFLILIIISFVIWFNIPNITTHFLSREFNVDVTLKDIKLSKNDLVIEDLNIGTPKNSKTSSSFFSKKLEVESSLSQVMGKTLTIDTMTLSNNIIGVEYYNKSGSQNNWTYIMNTPSKDEKNSKRTYLIKQLVINNITVVITKSNGQRQTYPTISRMVFYNISEETGFPIDELEKAISQAVLKEVFQRFNILHILKNMNPTTIIKKIVPIF